MNITNVIIAICSLLFLMIGADKFFLFLDPPCTLMGSIPPTIWKLLGGLQLAAGVLIWLPKFRKYVAGFFFVLMLVFIVIHLRENTYDIGGAAFMAVLLALVYWNPAFLSGKRKMRFFIILACLGFSTFSFAQRPPIPNLPAMSWEDAGFNLDTLDALIPIMDDFQQKDFRGLVVIKDNKAVIEWYYNTFWRTSILDIRSAGKSITSLLLGVAIKEGLVQNLDQDVYSFFSKEKYPAMNEDYKKIKLKHLLDMSSGLDADSDDGETPGNAGQWMGKEEWVEYLLSVPLANQPGEKWVYADINAVLIGAIIEEKSGMSLKDFAKEKVFDPLGITEFYWYTNAANQTGAAGNLYLSTLAFAKLGVLVANEGKWGDEQIVSADYIEKLLERKAFDLSGFNSLADSYGMLWYKTQRTFNGKEIDYLWASGNGGNHLVVVPEENMVIALTSTAYGYWYGHTRARAILTMLLNALE